MRLNVSYSPLQDTSNVKDSSNRLGAGKYVLPKITRLKVIGFIVIVLITVVLVFVSCLNSGYFNNSSICNLSTDKPQLPLTTSVDVRLSNLQRRLPQCLIIGARKAGTRAILTYLELHPDIVTKGDEMHFFDIDDFYKQGLEAYQNHMPPSREDQLTIEKTPAYFVEDEVPERVYRMNRTIRLLLILRDPIERAVSDWTQIATNMRSKNKKFESFEKHAIAKDGSINKSYKAISRSVYHRHLSRWLEFFSLQQIHIIDSKELVQKPFLVMRKVEKFLGLQHRIKTSNFYYNETKGFYCVQSDIKTKCLKDSKGRSHPDIDPTVYRKLRKYFVPHNLKLFKMIGQTFDWDG